MPNLRIVFTGLLFSLTYYISARIGLLFALDQSNSTPVWLPSGIALAFLLYFGARTWWSITLGALAVNFVVFITNGAAGITTAIWASAVISLGNTLEAVTGYYLLKKITPPVSIFHSPNNVFRFTLVSLAICLSSSIIGTATVMAANIINTYQVPMVFFTWWLGDLTGILLVTPLLLVWENSMREKKYFSHITELVFLLGILAILLGIIFWNIFEPFFSLTRSFLLLPLLIWVSLRFSLREVTAVIALISVTAILATIRNLGPFAADSLNESLITSQGYISIISITFLILASAMYEQKKSKSEILSAHTALDALMKERTEKLQQTTADMVNFRQRTNDLLGVLLKITQLDFSQKALIIDKRDELDAIGAGLNTMSEELGFYLNKINENNRFIEQLTEASPDFIGVFDLLEDKVTYTNKKFREFYGFSEGQTIDLAKMNEFAFPGDTSLIGTIKDFYKNHLESDSVEYEYRVKDKSAAWHWMLCSSAVINKENDNSVRFVLAISRDITSRKNAEYDLQKKTEELAASNLELEQFAYIASHDLQEPLRMVSSYVQLLASRYGDKLDQDARDFIHFAVDGTARMRNLINSLLEYSRVNKIKIFENINTAQLLGDVLLVLKPSVDETKTNISVGKLPDVHGDPVLVSQLFQNLISNAIKFRGISPPLVEINGVVKNNECLFSVKDNGIGIKKDYFSKLFVIFQRLHTKEEYPGTGIGLALCKKIVEKHGGKIWVESETDKESTFWFTLGKAL